MALVPALSNAAASAAADAVCALCNSGFFDIYDGTQPATANTAITTQVKLAHLTFGATAFAAAVNGVATANAIGADASADATGTASWFRAYKSDATSVVFDGSVGTSGANLNLSSVAIVITGNISISSFTYAQAMG
jgi:hypothetical protein